MSDRRAGHHPGCSVIVATLGRPEEVDGALAGVAACRPTALEVLVVDGDPTGSAGSVVAKRAARGVPVRHLASPPGLTRQRNVGLAACRGDVVVMLDDDARVPVDTLARLAGAYEDPAVVGATGRIVEPGGNAVGGKASAVRRLLPGGGREGGFTRFGYPRRLVDLDTERDVAFMQGAFMTARRDAPTQRGGGGWGCQCTKSCGNRTLSKSSRPSAAASDPRARAIRPGADGLVGSRFRHGASAVLILGPRASTTPRA